MTDRFELQRFVDAQAPIYTAVRAELTRGRKGSHWMWFVFPQIAGLGHSFTAQRYAISSIEEARAYLEHPVLGNRLRECTKLVNAVEGKSLREIFSTPDDLKFRSSMTLFAEADPLEPEFRKALEKYCGSKPDPLTLERLSGP